MIHYDIYSHECDDTGKIIDGDNDYIDEVESSFLFLKVLVNEFECILDPFEGFPRRKVFRVVVKKC